MTSISIVMPCFNRAHELERILRAYDTQDTHEEYELIAVDDGSDDATPQVLKNFRPNRFHLRVEALSTNRGPGHARNRGIELARAPIILFVGDDIRPERSFIRVHLNTHRVRPEVGLAVLGRVRWPPDLPMNTLMEHIDGKGAQQFSYFYFEDGEVYDFRHFYTANISLKRALLDRVDSWFDPRYTHAAFEDVELAYRLQRAGMKILYNESAVGNHYHYHTIRSFSRRQLTAGRMSVIFDQQHPGVLGKSPALVRRYRPLIALAARILHSNSPEIAAWLERTALELAAHYEWSPNSLNETLYLETLSYFWRRGVIEEAIADAPEKEAIVDLYARYSLAPALRGFVARAGSLRVDMPRGCGQTLVDRLTELEVGPALAIRAPLRVVRAFLARAD